MRSTTPVAIEHHALDTLRFIRSSMEAASVLTVPGTAGYLMGAVGVAAFLVVQFGLLSLGWIAVWLAAALIASVLGGVLLLRQLKREGSVIYSGPARRFFLCLCPGLLAGSILTGLFMRQGLDQYIAGMWLLLYGCSVLSASAMTRSSTIRLIATMGSLFVLIGVAALNLPTSMHNAALGAGFGGLHIVFGVLIGRIDHGK